MFRKNSNENTREGIGCVICHYNSVKYHLSGMNPEC